MNKNIKELMVQTLNEKFPNTQRYLDHQDLEVFSNYFAELIVKECSYRCYLICEPGMAYELSDLYGFKFDFKKMMEEDDE